MSERLDNLRLQIEQIQALKSEIPTSIGGYGTTWLALEYEGALVQATPALLEALPLLLDVVGEVIAQSTGPYEQTCVICDEYDWPTHADWCPMVALEAWAEGGVESGEGGKA